MEGEAVEDAIVGGGGAAVDEVDDLAGAVVDVGAHGEVDGAGVGRGGTVDDGDVRLGGCASLKLAREVAVGGGVERHEEEAGGVHVEAVDGDGAGGVGEGGSAPTGG